MGGSLYVSLFEAAQAATAARQAQMGATAQMGDAQTQILNAVTNSWTQSLTESERFSITSSKGTHETLSHATLSQLADHAAWAAAHASSKTAQEFQTILQNAQRSYQAAQANANAGVQAVNNQSGQDSYMMQQDAMLATTINSALQQTAALSISA